MWRCDVWMWGVWYRSVDVMWGGVGMWCRSVDVMCGCGDKGCVDMGNKAFI